jgi:hypothetical protein
LDTAWLGLLLTAMTVAFMLSTILRDAMIPLVAYV